MQVVNIPSDEKIEEQIQLHSTNKDKGNKYLLLKWIVWVMRTRIRIAHRTGKKTGTKLQLKKRVLLISSPPVMGIMVTTRGGQRISSAKYVRILGKSEHLDCSSTYFHHCNAFER